MAKYFRPWLDVFSMFFGGSQTVPQTASRASVGFCGRVICKALFFLKVFLGAQAVKKVLRFSGLVCSLLVGIIFQRHRHTCYQKRKRLG